jgi:hypothetical protein
LNWSFALAMLTDEMAGQIYVNVIPVGYRLV